MEVATMTDENGELLIYIFWAINDMLIGLKLKSSSQTTAMAISLRKMLKSLRLLFISS